MIESVSTLARSIGATNPSLRTNRSMTVLSVEVAHVDEMPCDRRGRGHRRTHQVGPAPGALPAFKVAVRRRGAALAGRQLVVVHAEAHRAARLAPLEAGRGEYLVEALLLGLPLHQSGARHDDRELDARRDLLALHYLRCNPQILDARIGAGADE